MAKWEKSLIPPEAPIQEALAHINSASTQLALVVDKDRRLLGTLSDGDVRRALIAGMALSDPVSLCMCRTPATAKIDDPRETVLARMRQLVLRQLPVLDAEGRVVGLKTLDELLLPEPRDNWVVIMAGGLGSRLKELTRDTPKPMLAVGNKPLLDLIVSRFVEQGFSNIWLAVNYHADQIERYFGNGEKFAANIQYLREDKRLGTAGALSMLPKANAPVLVSNADLLTKVDHVRLLEGHMQSGAVATMAVREHEYQIPYGVLHTKEGQILYMEEKPTHSVTVNAGMYVLAPSAIAGIPPDTFFDMPELFAQLIKSDCPVHCHHIEDYWLDIGHHEDLQRAHSDFPEVF